MPTVLFQKRIPVHGNGQIQFAGGNANVSKVTNIEFILLSNVTNDDTIKTFMPEVSYAFASQYKLDSAPSADNVISVTVGTGADANVITLRDPTDTTTLVSVWAFGRGDSE